MNKNSFKWDIFASFSNNVKRCHPVLPGMVLLVFLLSVASFISHIENISYFDAFYACFITYSTIGFGDIDIYVNMFENMLSWIVYLLMFTFMMQRTSYRSNWFNLMIYGNGVHIIGYMLLSAWLTTLLEKITKGDDAKCTECTLNKE